MTARRSATGPGCGDDAAACRRAEWADERGGAGLLAVLAGMLVTALGLVLVTAAVDVGVAAARARTAADAAALAAMAASPLYGGDGDGPAAAARAAEANGARIGATALDAWPFGVEVEVTVAPATPIVRAALPEVPARAAAALRHEDRTGGPSPALGFSSGGGPPKTRWRRLVAARPRPGPAPGD